MTAIATLDVGGTSIKSGAVRVAHGSSPTVELIEPRPAMADADADTILGQLAGAAADALAVAGPSRRGLAIGFPGPFDLEAGTALIHGLFKYESIYGLDLRAALRERLESAPDIEFVHDNEAAGVGEAVFGAGEPYRRVLTVTLGTGVGCCLTDGGSVIQWVGDLEVEKLARRPTSEGRADDVLSARGIAERYGVGRLELATLLSPRPLPEHVEQIAVDHGHRVGAFLATAVDELSLDAIVIGGGLSAAYDVFGEAIEAELPIPCHVETLGAAGPMLGAARLAFPDVV